jgi:hypothetical protein
MTWPYFNGVVKFEKLLSSLERLEFITLLSSVIGLGGVKKYVMDYAKIIL